MQTRKVLYSGKPHHRYSRYRKQISLIFANDFLNWDSTKAKEIHKTGIPISTIYEWKKHYNSCKEWRPWSTNRNINKQIFTADEENSIFEYIDNCFISVGKLFTNDDFKDVALHAYNEKIQASNDEHPKDFHCSKGFINNFKKRHRITSRKAHVKRRSLLNNEQNMQEWEKNISNLLANVSLENIVNADETFWKIVPNGLQTWAPINSHDININSNNDNKEGITVIASVTANRTKLPLFIIAKGKTDRCERSQVGDISYHYSSHSETGWTTMETFKQYLDFLRSNYNNNDSIHLILDSYSVHRCNEISEYAANQNIILHFIPAGMTDIYQPLDRYIFGVLKSKCKKYYRYYISNNDSPITKKDSISILIRAWEEISSAVIDKAWRIYFDD